MLCCAGLIRMLFCKQCQLRCMLQLHLSQSCCAEDDKKVLDACEDWLRQAEALVVEADAKIENILQVDGGSLLAEEWVTFVHKCSMQIKDLEQVSTICCLALARSPPHGCIGRTPVTAQRISCLRPGQGV